ncbi:MAG: hypothetical protein APR55_03040 [Methanolinea sp. SDB]|nr:MAG: hypothetical protein APR55_03040 [Methanolinea sp. SDB]
MRQKVSGSYTRAGTARRCGRGLALEIAGVEYYITPEDLPSLMSERPADVVNEMGEQEGSAWLSPVIQKKKQELTALIQNRLYVLSLKDISRLQYGIRNIAKIHEYNHG